MASFIYRYENCKLIRVIDGDTFIVSIDVGFNFNTIQRIRLLGCDMPERKDPGGKEASAQLEGYLRGGEKLVITTLQQDSFGRWLAQVDRGEESINAQDATEFMLSWLDKWKCYQRKINEGS